MFQKNLNYTKLPKGEIMGTEAQKRANKKYHDKTYKTFTVNAKITEYEKITKYCVNNDISKAQLLLKSALYCIDNDIDLSNDKNV